MTEYWPDLVSLPDGWRLDHILFEPGRAMVMLRRTRDGEEVYSTGHHGTPSSAFQDACGKARATGP